MAATTPGAASSYSVACLRYADTGLATGQYSTNILELYLPLTRKDPDPLPSRGEGVCRMTAIYLLRS